MGKETERNGERERERERERESERDGNMYAILSSAWVRMQFLIQGAWVRRKREREREKERKK